MLRPELLDEILQEYTTSEDLLGQDGILKQLTKALVERCLNGELRAYLETPDPEGSSKAKPVNRRNGYSKKTIKGEFGQVEIAVPRDRLGEFEPQILPNGQTRFSGFDQKILSL